MNILLTGGSGGLGRAIHARLRWPSNQVFSMGLGEQDDFKLDLACTPCIERKLKGRSFDGVIHCAGRNKIAPHAELSALEIERSVRINAISNFDINKIILRQQEGPAKFICHIISDAAWMPMTHSLAYNISKAAQLMVMRQMAHEHKPDPVIFGVSPGKIGGTGMSKYIDETFPPLRGMTFEEGRKYQLSRLRTGEMEPDLVAEFIVNLCLGACKAMHGHNYSIGG